MRTHCTYGANPFMKIYKLTVQVGLADERPS